MNIREELLLRCLDAVNQKIEQTQREIDLLQSDANEETKSSAGDKYETGRAMMQLEIDKLNLQLSEAKRQKKILKEIRPDQTHSRVQLGSVVLTNHGNFFIAIPAGKIIAGGKTYYGISISSPIGAKLLNQQTNDSFRFNNLEYKVNGVY